MDAELSPRMNVLRAFNSLRSELGEKASFTHVTLLINVATEHDASGITLSALARRMNLSEASVRGLLRTLAPDNLPPTQQKGSLAGLVQVATSDDGQSDVLVLTARGGHLMQSFARTLDRDSDDELKKTAKKQWAGGNPIRTF